MRVFAPGRPIEAAWAQQRRGVSPLSRPGFDALVQRLLASGCMHAASVSADGEPAAEPVAPVSRRTIVQEAVAAQVETHDRESAKSLGDRMPIVPVNVDDGVAPASLGLIFAYAREVDGGRLQQLYDFVPEFLTDEETLARTAPRGRRSSSSRTTCGRSSGTWRSRRWSSAPTPRASRSTAARALRSTTWTPRSSFAEYDHVDVAVRNEGEATFAEILDALDPTRPASPRRPARRRRAHVPERRRADRPHRGTRTHRRARHPSRRRTFSACSIPSVPRRRERSSRPIVVARTAARSATGAPRRSRGSGSSRSTGSSPSSNGVPEHEIDIASIADANFGIFERDVEIAEKIADLKRQYGYPRTRRGELREEHRQAPSTHHRDPRRRRDPDRRCRIAPVDGRADAEDHPAIEHQAREVQRDVGRVPALAAAARSRHHDGPARARPRRRSATTSSNAPIATCACARTRPSCFRTAR